MILFNITIIIEEGINDEWLQWINREFIPEITTTNLFTSSRLLRVIDSPNEGITYSLQFTLDGIDQYNTFRANYQDKLMAGHANRFENKFVSFSSLMEFINN